MVYECEQGVPTIVTNDNGIRSIFDSKNVNKGYLYASIEEISENITDRMIDL